jgi:hypothetical protein
MIERKKTFYFFVLMESPYTQKQKIEDVSYNVPKLNYNMILDSKKSRAMYRAFHISRNGRRYFISKIEDK